MNIPTELALKIVKDMKDIINQDLNFINTEGHIIASTDKKRIGQIHEASLKCIATNSDIVINSDTEYEGSKKGINIPVHLNNEIVGVIGITGDRKDVERFGKIIKSMTEILVKEAWLKELSIKKREQNRNIIETVLFGDYKAVEFYTSLSFPYTVIIGNINNSFKDNNDLYKILETFLVRNKKNIFTITSNQIIIFLNSDKKNYIEEFINSIQKNLSESLKFNFKFGIGKSINTLKSNQIIIFLNSDKKNYIEEFINSIQKNLSESLKFNFKFGIGKSINTLKEFNSSYSEAKNALKYILNFKIDKTCMFYSDLDLGILLPNIGQEKIVEFTEKVLGSIDEKEFESFYEIFNIYKKNNGSIKNASAELFMHKNTLQYQLNKIEKLTGYDPRNLKDFSTLDLAFTLKNFDYYKKKEQL